MAFTVDFVDEILNCYHSIESYKQFFLVALFITLNKKSLGLTIQMKATEQCFPLALFIILYNYNVVQ